ncbi:hypothetical protein DPMN_154583, partial [Dreissena polymorpha]
MANVKVFSDERTDRRTDRLTDSRRTAICHPTGGGGAKKLFLWEGMLIVVCQ